MIDFASQIGELEDTFRRVADRAPEARAAFKVGVGKFDRCKFDRPGHDGASETLPRLTSEQLRLLTIRAGGLLLAMHQAGGRIAKLVPPGLFNWGWGDGCQPWLVYLLSRRPTMGLCRARAPEGTRPCAADALHHGKGDGLSVIDEYAEVSLLGLGWLKARLPLPAPDAKSPPPAPEAKAPGPDCAGCKQTDPLPPARHSPDFRSVHWYGTDYTFTEAQAAVVALLWEAWENRTPDVGHRTLLANAKLSNDRLPDVFKEKGILHRAWGKMIRSNVGSKGSARLCPPAQPVS
jgi:hypothetical protein